MDPDESASPGFLRILLQKEAETKQLIASITINFQVL